MFLNTCADSREQQPSPEPTVSCPRYLENTPPSPPVREGDSIFSLISFLKKFASSVPDRQCSGSLSGEIRTFLPDPILLPHWRSDSGPAQHGS
jgi:hypothetical protein